MSELKVNDETRAIVAEAKRLHALIADLQGGNTHLSYAVLGPCHDLARQCAREIERQVFSATVTLPGSPSIGFYRINGELVRKAEGSDQLLRALYFSPGFGLPRSAYLGLLKELERVFSL